MFALIVIFLLGLIIGSFLNVVIIRGSRRATLRGRSRCEYCKEILSPRELIPVISFLLQKGRCAHCATALSWQYPLVELITALSFTGAWWSWQKLIPEKPLDASSVLILVAALIIISAALVIFVSDLRYRIIPNGAVTILIIAGLGLRIIGRENTFTSFVWALLFSAILASFWLFSNGRAMGLGDAKLIFATSLILGYPLSLGAFLFSFWLGGLAGLLLIISGKKTWQDQIPFGPFLLLGASLAYLAGGYFFMLSGLNSWL